jgi:hypothetical protein
MKRKLMMSQMNETQEGRSCSRSLSLVLLVALLILVPLPMMAQSSANSVPPASITPHAVPLIVEPIDESKRVVLPGNTRGEARRPELDRGPLDDSFPLNGMQLQLRRSPERNAARQ